MNYPDILDIYFPEIGEIDKSRVLDTRARVVAYLARGWPDVDMSPGSVFGDTYIDPAAYLFAALETAMGRYMSDLDLENVAQGIIYNCDFVEKYLGNFVDSHNQYLKASGVVRLVFNTDKAYTLDRGIRFRTSETDITNNFSIRLPFPGDCEILPTDGAVVVGENSQTLKKVGANTFVVDVPVVGDMNSPLLSGALLATNQLVQELVSVTALYDFFDASEALSLRVLAQRSRQTYYSKGLTSRGNAASLIRKEFPGVTGVSPVLSGDDIMLRTAANLFGVFDGGVDLYVKSQGFTFKETAVIKLIYSPYDASAPGVDESFKGILELPEIPYVVDSVKWVGDTNVALSYDFIMSSSDISRAPMLSAAYSMLDKTYINVQMPTDIDGDVITTQVDGDGKEYAEFEITYRADPLLKGIAAFVQGPDVAPVGVDVLVKGFVPIVISNMTVVYRKDAGRSFNRRKAREEILEYLRTLAYPDTITLSKLADSMFYAGAADVKDVLITAEIRWSLGTRVSSVAVTGTDLIEQDTVVVPPQAITTLSGLKATQIDPDLGFATESFKAGSVRNFCYVIDPENINFSEEL